MSDVISLVVTVYGHGDKIDNLVFNLFDDTISSSYYGEKKSDRPNATTYCAAMNRLELKDDSWVRATIVTPNAFYSLQDFLTQDYNTQLQNTLLAVEDKAVQKILREVNSRDLLAVIKYGSESLQEKFFRNMSKNMAQIIREDMAAKDNIPFETVKRSRKIILDIIHRMEYTGEINPIKLEENPGGENSTSDDGDLDFHL